MSDTTLLRVGIVGCGYQGSILAQTILTGDAWCIVACADPDQAASARVAAIAGGAAVYASAEELLQGTDVDAVFVATSHDALYECSLAAIQAGKHVLAEKPIGMDEREAAHLEDAAARPGICFMSGYSFRYIAAWQKVRELLAAGAVGEIHTIIGAIGIGPMSAGWRQAPKPAAGRCSMSARTWWIKSFGTWATIRSRVADIRYRADTPPTRRRRSRSSSGGERWRRAW